MQLDIQQIHIIQDLLRQICGIHLTDSKQTMMKNRINILLRNSLLRDVTTFDELVHAIKTNPQVKQVFINSFTTNKTDLFRESYHFSDMLNRTLIEPLRNNKQIRILCSACSSGEEAYSIATTCIYAKTLYKSHSAITIIATDIDTNMLEFARKGEYTFDPRLNKLPDWVEIEKYFNVKKTDVVSHFTAKSNIKNLIIFQQLNFFANVYPFNANEFDMVFCRNALIYFEMKNQENILTKLHHVLKEGGALYLGHSEDVLSLKDKFDKLGNKIFVKKLISD
ncbi:protein-glutamate O-methyltransferase CheR [Helicobacter aurati]|uniref:protein-glutamate O-methyltransferase n=1 Tax=Helicobacter aurati TaxID=137778 RepID=A0A3D8J8E8_9HELI|nr:protein-glutamate O-methyltransferase CheR [Helicobacter aurati]RDU73131.1 protein-glutamate O-methyltransferase CheR [Helicobacter aurati]